MRNQFDTYANKWRFIRDHLKQGWVHTNIHHSGDLSDRESSTIILRSPDGARVIRLKRDMWKDFALYVDVCRALPNNPYLQNIYDAYFLGDGTYCVEMERLYETNLIKSKYDFALKSDDVVSTKAKGEHVFLNMMINRCLAGNRPEMLDRYLKRDTEIREAMHAIYGFLDRAYNQNKRFDRPHDIHGWNMMVRIKEDKQEIVIIDPYTYTLFDEKSCEIPSATDILWRRKLGLPDYPENFSIERDEKGFGNLIL